MSIRFHGIPFESPLHLLDPRNSSAFYATKTKPTAFTFIKTLRSLYTRPNLSQFQNFNLMFLNNDYPTREEHQKFLEWTADVPEEKLYTLAFMQRDADDEYGSFFETTIYYLNFPSHIHENGELHLLGVDWIPTEIHSKEDFLAAIDSVHECWTRVTGGDATDYQINIPDAPICSDFVRKVLLYRQGYTLLTYNEVTYNAAKLKNLLLQNEAASYTVSIHPDISCILLQLVVPTETRQLIKRIFNYTTDVLQYIPGPLKEAKEQDPVLFGVELEVSTDYPIQTLIEKCEEPFFIAKQDSSITGDKLNRMELVTAPASFKYLKRAYARWFDKLDYDQFDVSTDTNNGMHVHVGRTHFLDDYHIRNFCWFFNNPAHAEFLLKISERGSMESIQRWAPFYQFQSDITRTQAFRTIYEVLRQGHLRGATNFKGGINGKTVEVRIFRGVVSYASIVKNLEFVDAVFHFSKGLTSYRELTLQGFINWLNKTNANQYILLKKFLELIGLPKILVTANLKDHLFNATHPDDIVKRLAHAPFTITSEHLRILSKGRKVTFFFNKEKGGTIDVVHHDRSKLFKYDKLFAQRYLRDKKSA